MELEQALEEATAPNNFKNNNQLDQQQEFS